VSVCAPFGSGRKKVATDDSPGPWAAWPARARADRAIQFIETLCIVPKGYGAGKPLKLAPYQKRWLRAVLRPGVRSAAMSVARGNGKSTLLAALSLWAVFDDRNAPQVAVVATTVSQAIRAVYGVALAMVDLNPELASRSIRFTAIGATRLTVPATRGELFPVSSEPAGLLGLDPSLAVCDEIGAQPQAAWDALLLASGKRPDSLVVGIGTPGTDRDNALWTMRQLVQEGAVLPGFHWTEYAAAPGADIHNEREWHKANPALRAGTMGIDALRMAVKLTPEPAFRTFRLGQWTDSHESWLGTDGRAVWDAIEEPWDFEPGARTWLGIDAALTRDTTAVVAVQLRPDGRMHARARIWTPTKDEPTDLGDVMAYVRELADRYRVEAVAYDPRFLDWPAKLLTDEGIAMVEIAQTLPRMTSACGDLYTLIRERGITHDRDDLFATHVMNARMRMNDAGWTLSKQRSRAGHIDAVIALALAVDRARQKKKTRSPLVVL
jgi:phage terminase large subunit-like protein